MFIFDSSEFDEVGSHTPALPRGLFRDPDPPEEISATTTEGFAIEGLATTDGFAMVEGLTVTDGLVVTEGLGDTGKLAGVVVEGC
jgi:hypothetical protein